MHERIAKKFYACLKQRAESIKVGNPLDEDCRLGPVVAEHQLAKIMDFIKVRCACLFTSSIWELSQKCRAGDLLICFSQGCHHEKVIQSSGIDDGASPLILTVSDMGGWLHSYEQGLTFAGR